MTDDTAVLVFGKSPVPGQVKTRLVPGLSAGQAARLYERMLAHALTTAVASALGPVTLHAHPDHRCPRLRALAQRHGTRIATQAGADLGARMQHALRLALRTHRRALLIGSDCPALRRQHLHAADRLLRDGRAAVVLVPAVDGGYVLVGAREPCPAMFQDIPWGSAHVMARTRERLRGARCTWRELPPLRDVDRIQDLDLVPAELRAPDQPPKF
jgi:hypothetical protein